MDAVREYVEVRLRAPNSPASIRLRNKLAIANQGLARAAAYSLRTEITSLGYEDMFQLGMIGLLKGLERYDPDRGVALSTFLVPYIRGEILHHFRDSGSTVKIPRRWRELYAKLRKVERALQVEMGRSPSHQELAARVGVPVERLVQVLAGIRYQSAIELDEQHDIPCPDLQQPEPEVDLGCKWQQLSQRIGQLAEAERLLVEAVYQDRRNRKQLAKEFKMDGCTLKRRLQQVLGGQAIATS